MLLVLVVGGIFVGSNVGADPDWGCESERIASTVASLDSGGGSHSASEAYLALVSYLIQDGVGDDSYLAALESRSGPDRFDEATGQLWINDKVQVEMGLTPLDDGTWAVGSFRYCSPRLPDLESPGETPSSEPTGVSTGAPSP